VEGVGAGAAATIVAGDLLVTVGVLFFDPGTVGADTGETGSASGATFGKVTAGNVKPGTTETVEDAFAVVWAGGEAAGMLPEKAIKDAVTSTRTIVPI
jgi:hypothetical protein